MEDQERDIELRFVIRTRMTDDELDLFIEEHSNVRRELEATLLNDEKLLSSLYTDKISYASKQLLHELGVE